MFDRMNKEGDEKMRFDIKRARKGTYPEEHKERTEDRPIEEASVPKIMVIPLSMHIGAPAKPVVEIGDKVKVGTLIGEAAGKISANVHSSVSGEVLAIEERDTANGKSDCVIIKNDYEYKEEPPMIEEGQKLDPDGIRELIRKAGIVGMGGASFPTDVKVSPPDGSAIDTIILNGAECEPYSTADQRLMVEYAGEIIEGLKVIQEIFQIKKTYIAIEDRAQDAIAAMREATADLDETEVKVMTTMYPQGSEKVLIRSLADREVPPGSLPAEIGVFLTNVSTSLAIYDAVRRGRPLTYRITTVTGTPLKEPKNLKVRIGTPVDSLIEDCGGYKEIPGKIINGGPFMGKPLKDDTAPVMKASSIILVQNVKEAKVDERTECIMCSQCLDVCPVNLQPILISNAYENGDIDKAEELGALDCIACGNCSFICPSKIPLLDNIRAAQNEIKARKAG